MHVNDFKMILKSSHRVIRLNLTLATVRFAWNDAWNVKVKDIINTGKGTLLKIIIKLLKNNDYYYFYFFFNLFNIMFEMAIATI